MTFQEIVQTLGIVIDVKPVQPSNASEPILVTESDILIDSKLVQKSNALLPILVTELGIVIDVKPPQPENRSTTLYLPIPEYIKP